MLVQLLLIFLFFGWCSRFLFVGVAIVIFLQSNIDSHGIHTSQAFVPVIFVLFSKLSVGVSRFPVYVMYV